MIAWYLAFVLLLAGLAWYPWCFEETCPDCFRCTTGTLVCSPSYTVSGFVDGACQCSRINGSYILAQVDSSPCKWVYPGPAENETAKLSTSCTDSAYELLFNLWAYVDMMQHWPGLEGSVQIRSRASIYRVIVGNPYTTFEAAHFAYYYYTDTVQFPWGENPHHDCAAERTLGWNDTTGSTGDDPCDRSEFVTATVIWQ